MKQDIQNSTIFFATSLDQERKIFTDLVAAENHPFTLLFPEQIDDWDDLIKLHQIDVIVTDFSYTSGSFIDWLTLWPFPFIVLTDYHEKDKLEITAAEEACDYIIRSNNFEHLDLLPINIKKILNHKESLEYHSRHLQASEHRFYELVQALPDIVYAVDESGYFTFVNNSVKYLGYQPKDLLGKHFSIIITPEDLPSVSRAMVLEKLKGKITGDDKAPKLFDERRTGLRKTKDLEVRLIRRGADTGNEKNAFGSVIAYGEVNSVGVLRQWYKAQELMSVGIIRDITHKKESEHLLQESLKEKEILLKEIHHRVKNNLQIISSLLSLQSHFFKDKIDHHLYLETQMQVQSMALVHEELYKSQSLNSINMASYINNLCTSLFVIYEVDYQKISYEICMDDDIKCNIECAAPLGLIIAELVSNSIKYAFPDSKTGRIRVTLIKKSDRHLLTIEDNGSGLPAEFKENIDNTFSWKLIQSLCDQLKGSLSIMDKKEAGAGFSVVFYH